VDQNIDTYYVPIEARCETCLPTWIRYLETSAPVPESQGSGTKTASCVLRRYLTAETSVHVVTGFALLLGVTACLGRPHA